MSPRSVEREEAGIEKYPALMIKSIQPGRMGIQTIETYNTCTIYQKLDMDIFQIVLICKKKVKYADDQGS